MNLYKYILLFGGIMLICSCAVKPKKINYGFDACHYCSMTIVDKVHAAQIVTQKGKAYSFDAIECMVNYIQDGKVEDDIALYLTNVLTDPTILVDATSVTYLKSDAIPSPMGAFLSAFKNKEMAEVKLQEFGGKLYNWEEINAYFKVNDY